MNETYYLRYCRRIDKVVSGSTVSWIAQGSYPHPTYKYVFSRTKVNLRDSCSQINHSRCSYHSLFELEPTRSPSNRDVNNVSIQLAHAKNAGSHSENCANQRLEEAAKPHTHTNAHTTCAASEDDIVYAEQHEIWMGSWCRGFAVWPILPAGHYCCHSGTRVWEAGQANTRHNRRTALRVFFFFFLSSAACVFLLSLQVFKQKCEEKKLVLRMENKRLLRRLSHDALGWHNLWHNRHVMTAAYIERAI